METCWPVFVPTSVQMEDAELFELGDVVTWPVMLIDAAAESGWPHQVGVQLSVDLTVDQEGRRWATTEQFDVCTRLSGSPGLSLNIRAGLITHLWDLPSPSFVTGTVRRIEVASTVTSQPDTETAARYEMSTGWMSGSGIPEPRPKAKLPIDSPPADIPGSPWELSETPVAPLRFADPGPGKGGRFDHGMLVHLELFRPHCRCREIESLAEGTGIRYAHRHLRQISRERVPGSTRYRCLDTGLIFTERYRTPRADPGVPGDQTFAPQLELKLDT